MPWNKRAEEPRTDPKKPRLRDVFYAARLAATHAAGLHSMQNTLNYQMQCVIDRLDVIERRLKQLGHPAVPPIAVVPSGLPPDLTVRSTTYMALPEVCS